MKPEDNTEGVNPFWSAELIDAAENHYGHYPSDEELESFDEMNKDWERNNL